MRTGRGIVTLLTDFGSGIYCGAMKGAILSVAPEAVIVDVCHSVAAQDISEAAFVLSAVAGSFPVGTLHCVVVDPGVGTSRRIILAEGGGYVFLAPDNGVLTRALAAFDGGRVWSVENDAFFRKPVSRTFHGRDIFAPVAGAIAAGEKLEAFGPEVDPNTLTRHLLPEPVISNESIEGRLIFIDDFGNLVSNITGEHLAQIGRFPDIAVEFHGHRVLGIDAVYAHARHGDVIALIGSSGHLEIAVVGASAAERFPAATGDRVLVQPAP